MLALRALAVDLADQAELRMEPQLADNAPDGEDMPIVNGPASIARMPSLRTPFRNRPGSVISNSGLSSTRNSVEIAELDLDFFRLGHGGVRGNERTVGRRDAREEKSRDDCGGELTDSAPPRTRTSWMRAGPVPAPPARTRD